MAVTAAIIAGVAGLGAAGIGAMGRNQGSAGQAEDLSRQQLQDQRNNALQQQLVQAMINQRAVAGSKDPYGGSMTYDPVLNQWVSKLGGLPKSADEAAMRASIAANTTDPTRIRYLNDQAMRRAAGYENYADTTRRELENFRPMGQDRLRGLLTDQAIEAARQSYDPLRNDVLRSTYRTGTAAGPVISELGRGEAQNLRSSLRDALITSMTQTDQINQARRSGLENAAVNANSLVTPQTQNPGASASTQGATLASLLQQRSANAPISSAYGMSGVNQANAGMNPGYANLLGHMTDSNFGLNQTISGLKDLSTYFSKGGGQDLIKAVGGWFGGGSSDNQGVGITDPIATGEWEQVK